MIHGLYTLHKGVYIIPFMGTIVEWIRYTLRNPSLRQIHGYAITSVILFETF